MSLLLNCGRRCMDPVMRLASAFAVVASGLVFSACPSSDTAAADAGVVAAANDGALLKVQAQLAKRLEAVHDYDVEGTVAATDGQHLRFRYAMQQPTFMAGEFLNDAGARTRAFVFDGKVLAVVDDVTKTVARHDLSANEEQLLLTLHETFSSFVCEGWRPPLLRPTTTNATVVGDTVELTVPINAAGLQRSVVVVDTNGAFVGKRSVADGEVIVASVTVTKSEVDAGTKLKFPTVWEQLAGGQRAITTLTSWKVNSGIAAERFSTAIPAGYAAVAAATP